VRILLAVLAMALALMGCGPAKTANNVSSRRVGDTVTTSCPATAPAFDDDVDHIAQVTGRVIERVCVIGTENEDNRVAIVKVLGFQEGDKLDPAKVRTGLEAIVALQTIDDVIISADPRGQDGVVVLVDVKERPRVDEVVFQGSKIFGDAKLNESNAIEKGTILDRRILNAMVQGLRDEYAVVGYAGAKVETSVETTTKGHARVRFTIKEGPLWKVSTLTFQGASKVSEADLKKAANMTEGAIFDSTHLDRSTVLIQAVYFDRGMIKAQVSEPKQDVTREGKVSITWTIDEGDVYKVDKIRVVSKAAGPSLEREALAAMKTKPTMVFDRTRFTLDLAAITQVYEKKGRIVEVNPVTDNDVQKKTVNITLEISDRR